MDNKIVIIIIVLSSTKSLSQIYHVTFLIYNVDNNYESAINHPLIHQSVLFKIQSLLFI